MNMDLTPLPDQQPMIRLQPELQSDWGQFQQRGRDPRDDQGSCGDGMGRELRELRAVHAETVQELEKTRTLLLTQSRINQHFQSEVRILTRKVEGGDRELGKKLQQQERVLQIRSSRILKLEGVAGRSRPIGQLEYWVRFRLPGDEVIGRYAEDDLEVRGHPASRQQGALSRPLQVTSRVQDFGKASQRDEDVRESVSKTVLWSLDSSHTETDGSETQTTDSDELVQFPLGSPTQPASQRIRVEVLWLSLSPGGRAAGDPGVRQLYVEYLLPGVPLRDTETPVSLRKPRGGEKIHFNFSKVIHLQPGTDRLQREFLSALVQESDPNEGRLKFTVVSEPLDGNEDCVEVGYSYVPISRMYQTGKDIIEKEFDIVEPGQESVVIGKLAVSVEGAVALRAIMTCRSTSGGQDPRANPAAGKLLPRS
ncbi:uncharacterized protein LOC144489912 [Mustelus asterias]